MRFHLSRPISVLALLFVALFVGAQPAMARPPSQVELSGEFEILRDSDDPCQISVPTKIKGTLTLKIDFVEGTAEGSLQGSGSGSDVVPPGLPKEQPCSGEDGTDVYRAETSFSGVISRDAHDVLTDSELVGRVDGSTGEFVVYAIIDIEGSGSHGSPGSTYYLRRFERPTDRVSDWRNRLAPARNDHRSGRHGGAIRSRDRLVHELLRPGRGRHDQVGPNRLPDQWQLDAGGRFVRRCTEQQPGDQITDVG